MNDTRLKRMPNMRNQKQNKTKATHTKNHSYVLWWVLRISKTEKSINDAQEKNRSPKMYKNNTDSRILNSNSI